MESTDKEIHLMAQPSWDRRLYAERKGADLGALQELGRHTGSRGQLPATLNH
jgi:hypothetical protein